MKTYTFHTDPGHGWLEVTMQELIELDLVNKITSYSYKKNGIAYLEEDCDASMFLEALSAKGFKYELKRKSTNHDSFIRSLQPFIV